MASRISSFITSYWQFLCLQVFIFFGYCYMAPTTVQSLDSGEIVANSFGGFVMHPPGYPLLNWYLKVITNVLPFESVFLRASLGNIFLAMASLSVLFLFGRKLSTAFGTLLVLNVASNELFWKYSLIPEVFMLHLFLTFAILYWFFNRSESSSYYFEVFVGLLSLACLNHHSSVFLFPLLFFRLWKEKVALKRVVVLFLSGLLVTVIGYSSLLLLDTGSPFSWAELKGFPDILTHFLRQDYGTFQLSADEKVSYFAENLNGLIYYLIQDAFAPFLLFAAGLTVGIRRNILDRNSLIALISLVAYVGVFFGLANIQPKGVGLEVISRFYLFPFAIFLCISVFWFKTLPLKDFPRFKVLIFALLILSSLLNIWKNFERNNFRENRIIEQWAMDRLKYIDDRETILLTDSDTGVFSIRYLQIVNGAKPNVFALTPSLLFKPWMARKIRQVIPKFKFNEQVYSKSLKFDLQKDLVIPNLSEIQLNVETNFTMPNIVKKTFHPLGISLSSGGGIYVDALSTAHILTPMEKSITSSFQYGFSSERNLYAQYCTPYIAQARYVESESHQRIKYLEMALTKVPYCLPAAKALCQFTGKDSGPCLLATDLKDFKGL